MGKKLVFKLKLFETFMMIFLETFVSLTVILKISETKCHYAIITKYRVQYKHDKAVEDVVNIINMIFHIFINVLRMFS